MPGQGKIQRSHILTDGDRVFVFRPKQCGHRLPHVLYLHIRFAGRNKGTMGIALEVEYNGDGFDDRLRSWVSGRTIEKNHRQIVVLRAGKEIVS